MADHQVLGAFTPAQLASTPAADWITTLRVLDADFLVVQEDKIATVEGKLENAYYTTPLTIRSYQDTSKLYLSAKVFKDFFPGQTPDFSGKSAGR